MSCKVSFIGLGVMGYPMAGYISKAGHNVTVYNRTKSKAEKWIKQYKGTIAETPEEAAKDSDFVFTCVGNDNDLNEVAFGNKGIFNTINPSVYESRSNPVKPKATYAQKDLKDWSLIRGITVNWPDVFPVNSVKAMRGVFFAQERNKVPEYVELVFYSYWTNNLDISLDKVLAKIVEELGWSSDQFISFINLESTKQHLKLNTEELAKRGGFGSPTMFVDGENMFFGNDRLNLIN